MFSGWYSSSLFRRLASAAASFWCIKLGREGALASSAQGFRYLLSIAWPFYIGPEKNLHELAKGKWAVVTGATDGIGKAYAFELASKGFNLILISRTEARLHNTREEIQNLFNVDIRIFVFDFTTQSLEDYKPMLARLDSIDVGILINNVGLPYDYPEIFHSVSGGIEKIHDMLHINIHPPTLLSYAVIPQMLKRRGGVIVNIGSSSGFYPMKLWTTYSAAKKYVEWFSKCLRKEYESQGIVVQCVCPLQVATKQNMVRALVSDRMVQAEPSLMAPSPSQFAKTAIRSIGLVSETTGHPSHQVQSVIFWFPDVVLDMIIGVASRKLRTEGLLRLGT